MDTPKDRAPAATCARHGFALSRDGSCIRCVREEERAAWNRKVTLAAALLALLAVGAVAGFELGAPKPARTVLLGARASSSAGAPVVEKAPPASASAAPRASSESARVLREWELELARAESVRSAELSAEAAAQEAAEKKRVEDALRLPEPTEPAPNLPQVADEVMTAPAASAFIVIPLRVFVLQSDSVPALSASPSLASDVPGFVEKVNRIWAAAGVSLSLEDVTVAQANSNVFESSSSFAPDRPPRSSLRYAIPVATRWTNGFRIYFVHDFDANGVYFGRGEAFVRELAAEHPVRGGLKEAIPRVMAHEIGHGLGLGHIRTATHLMAPGRSGTRLGHEEVATARAYAARFPGSHAVGSATPPAAVADVAGRKLDPW